jgi:hypothetical protein
MATERPINLAPLERANARLGRFLSRYAALESDHPDYDVFLAAIVKGFEFTYGQAVNAIRRYVTDYIASPGAAGQMLLPDIIRVAARNGLIGPPEEWFDFRDRRNETAHEYFDEEVAERIARAAPELHNAVEQLIGTLRGRLE